MMARTPLRLLMTSGFAALALGLAEASSASAGNLIEISYVADIAGATVLKVDYRAEIGADRFEASLSGKTSGMSSMFSGYKMDLSANGKIDPGGFRSVLYENDRKKSGKKKKSTDILWQPDGSVTISREGQNEAVPPHIASALGDAASDPLTAILKMANSQQGKPCSGKYRAYDGKDVFDLALTLDEAQDNKIKCKLTWTPVAGDAVEKGEKAESYGLSLAPVQLSSGRVLHLPLQITGRSNGLKVTITASSVNIDGREMTKSQN
ncbi:DUF3108 domain-containing protein [Aestuariivirga sp.]|uniref:DUF3108 domain-containing protein n=1 Tax=Aestuariivirga sp. TaxID=2650926 RepID=UPI0039E5C958